MAGCVRTGVPFVRIDNGDYAKKQRESTHMALMTREQILGAQDIAFEDIDLSDIPGWGTVRIKDLSAAERDRLEAGMVRQKREPKRGSGVTVRQEANLENIRARFCAPCIVGEDMRPLFTEADLVVLGGKSARALDRIFDRIKDRNGLNDEAVQELVENFETGQTDDSPTV